MCLYPFRPLKGKPGQNSQYAAQAQVGANFVFGFGFPFRGRKGWLFGNATIWYAPIYDDQNKS